MVDIHVDQLTDSIFEIATGKSYETELTRLDERFLITQSQIWIFDWKKEARSHDVYGLYVADFPGELQGLISLSDKGDSMFVSLVENAFHNIGPQKRFRGVGGNLFAYACKSSFDAGYDGFISFVAKSGLVKHYEETLGAKAITAQLMFIDTSSAKKLVERYF